MLGEVVPSRLGEASAESGGELSRAGARLCAEHQPQRAASPTATEIFPGLGKTRLLRLVCDTAALRRRRGLVCAPESALEWRPRGKIIAHILSACGPAIRKTNLFPLAALVPMIFVRRISRPVRLVLAGLVLPLAYVAAWCAWRTPNPARWPERFHADAQTRACRATLREIDIAIQEWAWENHAANPLAVPTEIIRDRLRGLHVPACPAGGAYAIGTVAEPPRCSVHGTGL